MKRSHLLLAIVAAVLVVALFYMFAYRPQMDLLAEVEVEIAAEQTTQVQLEGEIARLRSVRETAPEVEARLAAAEAIVPRDAALPSALRQLQLAADESGVTLQSVATTRPIPIEGAVLGLSSIGVSVQMSGGYYQVVDFLRRIEDPAITPRGLTWDGVTVARDEYPTLTVALNGRVYALIATPPPPVTEVDPAEGPDGEVDPDADPQAETEDVT
jgi:Tfp pilus assembly protein PilO